MDVSYLILFVEFFCHTYIFGGAKNDINGSTLTSSVTSKRDVLVKINEPKEGNELKLGRTDFFDMAFHRSSKNKIAGVLKYFVLMNF